jgi:hypothetical protein
LPLQAFAPGLQAVQPPFTHDVLHAGADVHWKLLLHVCGVAP